MTNEKKIELINLEKKLAIYEETKRGYEELIEKYDIKHETMMMPYNYKGERRERPMSPEEQNYMVEDIKKSYKEILEEIKNIKSKINVA